MAKVGKHAIKGKSSSDKSNSRGGAHAISRNGKVGSSFGLKVGNDKKRLKADFSVANIIKAILLLAVCFVMITPLKSCMLSDSDYIGITAAQKIAIDDSGIPTEKASNVHVDLVKIDGEVYYKIQFSGTVTDYRYIVDAVTGDILARSFYHIDGE